MFSLVVGTSFAAIGFAVANDDAEKVKAIFLFKFFDYTSWPDETSPEVNGAAKLCVFGAGPIDETFSATLAYVAQRKSKVVSYGVEEISDLQSAKRCHIVFFSPDKYEQLKEMNGETHVLTVGDGQGFIESGGAIEMRVVGERVKIRVHLENVRRQNVKLSARLLDIADVIR